MRKRGTTEQQQQEPIITATRTRTTTTTHLNHHLPNRKTSSNNNQYNHHPSKIRYVISPSGTTRTAVPLQQPIKKSTADFFIPPPSKTNTRRQQQQQQHRQQSRTIVSEITPSGYHRRQCLSTTTTTTTAISPSTRRECTTIPPSPQHSTTGTQRKKSYNNCSPNSNTSDVIVSSSSHQHHQRQRRQQQVSAITTTPPQKPTKQHMRSVSVSSSSDSPPHHPPSIPTVAMASSSSSSSSSSSPGHERSSNRTPNNNDNDNTNNNNNNTNDDDNDEDDRTSRDYYFDSYSHHGIHEEMLKDEVRTKTYQMAILNNSHLFRDKVVLDVGCGTGILSMFAAQAGARHVYGVDYSSIIDQAKQIIDANGFSERITLIKGKVEEIDLPVPSVDIIISEWMGYFLLYESMLDTVIFARDKWLIPDGNGIIFPDKAVMYIAAIEDAPTKHDRIDYWDDVYGFDMSPIKELAVKEPLVDVVDAKSVLSNCTPILNIDILTCTKEQLSFASQFKLRALRNDYIHGFVAYFECAFTQVHKPIGFSTAPFAKYTHWKQTIFYLREALTICEGEEIGGRIACVPNKKNPRDLDIELKVRFRGRHSQMDTTMAYRLR